MAVASVTIKGQNNIGEAVKSASKDLNTLADSAKKAGKIFATAFGVGSAVAIIKKATSEMKKFVESVDDPKLKNSFTEIKSSFTEIKTTLKDVVSYSISPLVEKFSHFFGDMKGNIENIVIYVGAVIKNLPNIFAEVFSMIGQMIQRLFSWEGLKIIISTLFDNIVAVAGFALKAIFQSIPAMLWDLFSGVMLWLDSVAVGLTAKLIGAVEDFINKTQDKIADSWIGKLFGINKDAYIDLGKNSLLQTQKNLKAQSQAAFAGIGSEASNLFHGFIDTAKDIGKNTADAFDNLFGDILRGGIRDIADGVTLTVTEMKEYVSEAKASRAEAAAAGSGSGNASTESESSGSKSVNFKFNRKAFDEGLLASVAPITQLLDLFSELGLTLNPIQEILDSFMETLGSMLRTVIQPLHDILSWIGSSLAKTLAPVLEVLGGWIQLFVQLLSTILQPVIQLIGAAFQIMAPVLEILNPLFKLLAQGIITLMAPVKFLADLFSWVGQWVQYFGDCVGTAIYNISHPFHQKSFGSNPGSFHSSAFTDANAAISALGDNISTGIVASTSTSTATSSASYQGATQVTINIYQQSPVVGDGGMRAFAKMIHDEFDALAYYGV